MHPVRLATKVDRRVEHRHPRDDAPGVTVERGAAVLFGGQEIHLAVAVPVDHRRRHDAQIAAEAPAGGIAQETPRRPPRPRPRADVLEIREAVEEVADDHVEIAVAVPVVEHWDGISADLGGQRVLKKDRFGAAPFLRAVTLRLVADKIHHALERAVRPHAVARVRVVPAVRLPVAEADDEVVAPVAVVVGESPHVTVDLHMPQSVT